MSAKDIMKKYIENFRKKVVSYRINKYREKLEVGLDSWAIQMLKNQVASDSYFNSASLEELKFGLDVVVRIVKKISILNGIISIQPATMPASLIMCLTSNKEGGFTLNKVPIVAMSRKLNAEYSPEDEQEFRCIRRDNASKDLIDLLASEISNEILGEVVKTLHVISTKDVDLNWAMEEVAKTSGRGSANFIVASNPSELAKYGNYVANQVVGEPTLFLAGSYNGVPVYGTSRENILLVGYKGKHFSDSGLFYVPYVLFNKYKTLDPSTCVPAISHKIRYGMVQSPLAQESTAGLGALTADSSAYYRSIKQ